MERYKGTLTFKPRYSAEVVMDRFYLNQDNLVSIVGLREDVFGGTYLNAATASATLFDLDGTTVSGASFPISLTYQTSSPGIYEGHIPGESLSLTEGLEYDLIINVDEGGAKVASWTRRLVAVFRR